MLIILWYIFVAACFLTLLAVAIVVVVSVPQLIFSFPYYMWVGTQNGKGKYLELKEESVFRGTRNAYRLYKSWITKKPPVF